MHVSRSRPGLRRLVAVLGGLALALILLFATDGAATATHHASSSRVTTWAPVGRATITPGVMMYTKGAQCTANFVFTDATGHVYVGYAAHCAGLGESTDTNGCHTRSRPLGTRVSFTDGGNPVTEGTRLGGGTLAYSSWDTEHRLGTTNADTCAYNDLALVRVDARDEHSVNPSVPFWGGPSGVDTNGTRTGDRLYTYGNSSLRAGITVLSPHVGLTLANAGGGWSHELYSLTPGIPGDSGSGFMTSGGMAVGVLSTIGLLPLPASNNIGDLAKELTFAQAHSGIRGLQLTRGTVRFHGLG